MNIKFNDIYKLVSVHIPQLPPNAPIESSGFRELTNIDESPFIDPDWTSIILLMLNIFQRRVITLSGGHLFVVDFTTGNKA